MPKVVIPFYVCNGIEDIIVLGMDYLEKQGASVGVNNLILDVKGRRYSL